MCVKEALQKIRGVGDFERLCVWPQTFNRCFDWDISGAWRGIHGVV